MIERYNLSNTSHIFLKGNPNDLYAELIAAGVSYMCKKKWKDVR